MSKRACVLAEVLAAALMAVAAALLAGEAYGADDTLSLRLATWLSVPAAYDPVVAEVTVNRQKRGEFTLVRSADGDFYARAADLPALGLAESLAPRRTVQFQGEAHVSLKSLVPQRLAFDDKRLALEVDFPAEALRGRSFDLTPPRPGIAQGRPDSGAFLNYRLSASDGAAGEPQRYGLAHELAARFNGVLLRNEAAFVSEGAATRGLRYNTQLVYDRPQDQQRYIVGDQTAASGELGSTAAIGGIGLAKHYPLTPNVVRQPLAGYAGAVSTPSLVEVRMGGVPVFREQVPAGPFELRNLQQYAGARDVEVVVRDALGREQTIGFPYYFADQALRQGLHEYSYSAGALRENLGVSNGDYGAGVFSAFHRYGLNDRVTLGGRGEAASGLKNFGPTALYRDDRLGAFSAAYSLSERDGQDGRASSLGHVYQSAGFGTHLNARRYSERYAVAQDLVAPLGLKAERLAGGSLALPRAGTLFLDRTITERWALPAQQATRLGYSYSMGRRGSLFATFTRTHQTSTQNQLFVGLLLTLDPAKTLHLSARRDASGNESLGAQFSSTVPAGEGLGYRLGAASTVRLAMRRARAAAATAWTAPKSRWPAPPPGSTAAWASRARSRTAQWRCSSARRSRACASTATTRRSAAPTATAACWCRASAPTTRRKSRSTRPTSRSTTRWARCARWWRRPTAAPRWCASTCAACMPSKGCCWCARARGWCPRKTPWCASARSSSRPAAAGATTSRNWRPGATKRASGIAASSSRCRNRSSH